MRLVDLIAPGHMPDADCLRRFAEFGSRTAPELILDAPVRYVLDADASEACAELVRECVELFDPGSPLLRLPAESFWAEWFEEPKVAGARAETRHRHGVYVETDIEGRSGRLLQFAWDGPTRARMLPAMLEFNLDEPPRSGSGYLNLEHARFQHVSRLLQHVCLRFDPAWMARLRARGAIELIRSRRLVGEEMWFALPMVLAFGALMNSRDTVSTKKADLQRLNAARAKRGRRPLADHIEVSLNLGRSPGEGFGSDGGSRAAPRLHYVRGHYVRRSDKTFWRSPHLRGDHESGFVQRTVRVTRRGPALLP